MLCAIYLIGLPFALSFPSQLLTPVSPLWGGAGAFVGLLLTSRIMWLSRNSWFWTIGNPGRFNNIMTIIMGLLVTAFLCWSLGRDMASIYGFRGGGVRSIATYPVVRLITKSGRHSSPGMLINPYAIGRPLRISTSYERAQQLRVLCGDNAECRYADLCVEVPIERANDGTVRMLINENENVDFVLVKACRSSP